jgi:hypothetical protein
MRLVISYIKPAGEIIYIQLYFQPFLFLTAAMIPDYQEFIICLTNSSNTFTQILPIT